MGLKNGQLVFKGLQTAAPNAFSASVNPKVGYSTFAVDLMSLWHSLMNGCQSGRDIVARIKFMLKQHRQCSKPESRILSVVALEDYAETPINKEIERAKRGERVESNPYSDFVEMGDGATVALTEYNPVEIDSPLPKDFNRARSTPGLVRKLLRFICRLIEENINEIVDGDPQHVVIVDGYRDYRNLSESDNEHKRNTDAAKKIGIWRSDTKELLPKTTIGEGEVKACSWAFQYHEFGHVLVHANDGDIIALLVAHSARVNHKNMITGVMSTSYRFPILDIFQQPSDSKEESKKVFCSMSLTNGIYESINKEPTKGLVMTYTFLLFMLMCGNDYVDNLPMVGPAKLLKAIEKRRAGLLDRAVQVEQDDVAQRFSVVVDEKAILETLAVCGGSILRDNGVTPEFLSAWLRRVVWTLDYNINGPLGLKLLDCCAKRDDLSLHGFKLNEEGRCVVDDVVYNPTFAALTMASERPKKTKHDALDNAPAKRKKVNVVAGTVDPTRTTLKDSVDCAADVLVGIREAESLPEADDAVWTNCTPAEFKSQRAANLGKIRNLVPFGTLESK